MRRAGCVLIPLLFLGTCFALLGPSERLANPTTNAPLLEGLDYPVLVMHGRMPSILITSDPSHVPPPPAGASYLVPDAAAVERYLREHQPPEFEGVWVVHVKPLAPGRQQIELYLRRDGYRGLVYEATAASIKPKYRKITGPGFAFIFGGIATAISLAIWLPVWIVVRLAQWRRRSRSSAPVSAV